jgi:uncharacterized protein (DUF697 family)
MAKRKEAAPFDFESQDSISGAAEPPVGGEDDVPALEAQTGVTALEAPDNIPPVEDSWEARPETFSFNLLTRARAEEIVKNRSLVAAGIGLVPLPAFNLISATVIQVSMVQSITRLYNIEVKKSWIKNVIASVLGGAAAIGLSGAATRGLGAVPVLGTSLAVLSAPAMNGLTTYAVGYMFIRYFESPEGFLKANVRALGEWFAEGFRDGREKLGGLVAGKARTA